MSVIYMPGYINYFKKPCQTLKSLNVSEKSNSFSKMPYNVDPDPLIAAYSAPKS